MRVVLLVLVFALAFAAGLCVGLLPSTHNTDNTNKRGNTQSPSPPTGEPSVDRLHARDATSKKQFTALENTLAKERAKNADLTRQLEELNRRARTDANALAPLDEPRRWLEHLLPAKFTGLTKTELRHMRELDLSSSKLDVHDLAYLNQLPALRWLTLRRTAVDDTGLTYLLRVPSLVRLGLRETKVTDAGMPTLGAMKRLEHLDLNMLPVTDRGLQHLRSLQSLKFLRLNYTQVTDAGMQHIAQLRALERLDLWGTRVTDKGLDQLWHLPALNHLELGATAVSKDWVERFTRDHPKCYVRSRHGR